MRSPSESCPPPQSYDGSPWDLLKAIRLFTVRFGVVNSFRAYWDLGRCLSTSTESLKAVMPSMGINLVECSLVKEYDRDALSRTLAGEPNIYTYSRCRAHRSFKVEVLVSAIDDSTGPHSAEPDIIMIFSGDGAILHPISLLTLRGYTVFLVVPEQSDHLTSSRATRVFDWNTDILDIKQQRSPASVSMVSIGSQSGPSVTSHKASGTTHSFSVSNLGTPISSSNCQYFLYLSSDVSSDSYTETTTATYIFWDCGFHVH